MKVALATFAFSLVGGLVRVPLRARWADRVTAATERLRNAPSGTATVVWASAVTGIPPFYGISVAAGALRVRFPFFLGAGLVGRFVRFAVVFAIPRAVPA